MNARSIATRWALARAGFAARLASNASPGPAARLLGSAWGAVSARGLARPLLLPAGVRAIGVGGASLGGSSKTPFSIALARALAARSIDVALVGHAYRARPGVARIVRANDDVAEVGDDALFAARSLAGSGVDVIVGPNRQTAATFAAQRAPFLVFDGLLQTRPQRLARSILLLDDARPGHRAYCPPAGDLRAPRHALLQATDLGLVVTDPVDIGDPVPLDPPQTDARFQLVAVRRSDGSAVPLDDLRGAALGLVLAIARPDRVVRALANRGLCPIATVVFPDHHRPSPAELDALTRTTHRIDAWLTTGKCATKLPSSVGRVPVLVLDHVVRLTDRLIGWAAADGPGRDSDFRGDFADDLFPTAGPVR